MSRPEVFALVTARGGSKGLPGKNIRTVAGRPLIAWTIEAALKSGRLARVFLSTDDPEIARIGRECGAEVPFLRPAALARDDTPHLSVIDHALDWFDGNGFPPEYLCLLQPTSPLRLAGDIDGAIQLAFEKGVDAVIGVCPAQCHPFLSRRIRPDGTLADFIPTDIGYLRRQDLPPAFMINGAVYVCRTASLRRDRTLFPPGAVAYVMPPERSVDIDTELDLMMAECLLERRHAAI